MRFVVYVLIGSGLAFVGMTHNRYIEHAEEEVNTAIVVPHRDPVQFSDPETPMRCTFNRNDDVGYIKGVAYLAGTRMMSTSTSWLGGQLTTTGSYSDGYTMYVWNGTPEHLAGATFRVDAEGMELVVADEETGTFPELPFTRVYNGVEHSCEAWEVNDAVFTVPDTVEFVDMDGLRGYAEPSPLEAPELVSPPVAPRVEDLPNIE